MFGATDEVALGVFTHRTTYLPGLLESLRAIGDPPCVCRLCGWADQHEHGTAVAGAASGQTARYRVFLDDDIEFLGGDVLSDCVKAMVPQSLGWLLDLLHLRPGSTKRGPGIMRPGGWS